MLFKRQDHGAALTSSIYSSTVAKTNRNASTTSSTSVKNISHEASGQVASVNEPQEDEHYSDVDSLSSIFVIKKYI